MIKFMSLILKREFHKSPKLFLKEIVCTEQGKTTVIEGKHIPSPREPYLVKVSDDKKKACPVCRLGLDIKHTDVLILSQFVRSDGCMLPRRITGLCAMQQKRIGTMVLMAHKAGLLTGLVPKGGNNDPSRRDKWKKYNHYFDESTIVTHWKKTKKI